MNSVAINNDQFDTITSVNISFSNRVDDVLGCVEDYLSILSELLHKEVVPDELIIEDGSTQLGARALHAIGQLVVGADSVIAIDDALSFLVQAAQEVESVEGHEAARVEGVAQELGE